MRRSVRDAIVGFSILGAIVAFTGSLFWVRGIRLGSKSWRVTASFSNATGLAERSPVTYRGILIGSVKEINVDQESVKAILEINRSDLRLPLPVTARVVTSSILGGDVQVALESQGKTLNKDAPLPTSKNCAESKVKVLCNKSKISGSPLTSISTLTESFEQLVRQTQQQEVIKNLVGSAKQFDLTQKNLDELILQMKEEVSRAEPIITNLTNATTHIKNIVAAIDNPKTLNDIKETANSARSMTEKIDAVGEDVEEMMSDPKVIKAVRSVTIGLGEFFNELYPVQTKSFDE